MTDLHADFRPLPATDPSGGSSLLSRFFWAKPRKSSIIAGAFALLLLITYVDYITGPEVNFPLAYSLPAILATWYVGRRAGYLMSLACTAAELCANQMGAAIYTRPSTALWNAAAGGICLLLAVALLAAFKDLSTRLTALVEERTNAVVRLARELSEAEDSERRRLAHDIHDGLGQMLSVLKLNLAVTLTENVEGSSTWHRLHDALGTVNELIQMARTLTFEISPPMLDTLGLVPTLQHFCEQFSRRTGIEVTVNEEGSSQRLWRMTANYLFRSVKELVNNAAKHGPAKEVVVSVHWTPGRLRMMIDDDGSGFDPANAIQTKPGKCLGLAGIHERLRSLGGRFLVESSAGKGTRVVLEVPLTAKETSE